MIVKVRKAMSAEKVKKGFSGVIRMRYTERKTWFDRLPRNRIETLNKTGKK